MKSLTKRQSVILTFISEVISNEGMPPTRKEIALNAKIYDFTTCRDRIRDFYLDYEKKGHLPKLFSWNKTIRKLIY